MDAAYLDFLYRLGEFNIKLGLDTIRTMLEKLGNPHRQPRIIHIAGTNGKGSTLAALESLLMASGFSVGSTISPHLISYNERFRINGSPVEDDLLNRAFLKVCRGCGISTDLSSPSSEDGELRPTFFEFTLAVAFVLFESEGLDFILLETGLGGRLDATNVVEKPLACVITRVDIDHQEYLGDRIEQIALEKLGILKQGSPVFVARQEPVVDQLIRSHCREAGIVSYTWPEDFQLGDDADVVTLCTREISSDNAVNSAFSCITVDRIGLPGDHQQDNVLTALAVFRHVVPAHRRLDAAGESQVIKSLCWPGRLQYLGHRNEILLDGAHNASGMRALVEYLQKSHENDKVLLAVGWMKNKNLFSDINPSICKQIRFIPMRIDNDRSESTEIIVSEIIDMGFDFLPAMSLPDLVSAQSEGSLPAHDLLVVAGSLYLVGEFLNNWDNSLEG